MLMTTGWKMVEEHASQPAAMRVPASFKEVDAVVGLMNKSIDVARLQFKRVRKDLDDYNQFIAAEASVRLFDGEVESEKMSRSKEIRTALFADVHFLLISLHETEQLLFKLKRLFPLEAELSNLHNRHRQIMRHCSEFRAHMEYFEGRETEDLGELADTVFTLQGRSIDLGPCFEKDAEVLFSDLVSTLARISERQRKIRGLIRRDQLAS